MKRKVFYVSDGTGITAETLGQSLLSQFPSEAFDAIAIPNVIDVADAELAVSKINASAAGETLPIIFATLMNAEVLATVASARGILIDFFRPFIPLLENSLGLRASGAVGRAHGVQDYFSYTQRIEAVNFALVNDDGASLKHYPQADVIIVGVSRSGKTPTSLYLAMQFGLFVANYPFTEEDILSQGLPPAIKAFKQKLFGLTIDPLRLQRIRQERRPDSQYAALGQCQQEISEALQLYQAEGIPFIDTTARSIEEIASALMAKMDLKRRIH